MSDADILTGPGALDSKRPTDDHIQSIGSSNGTICYITSDDTGYSTYEKDSRIEGRKINERKEKINKMYQKFV